MHITYPPELPVSARRDDIAAAISDHQVVIVAGETGSGKTTQLPKICLELGRGAPDAKGRPRLIGHTQPRRIAARSVATRIASELGTELGDVVGFQVRFTAQTSAASRIKLMTDGILLAELQRDRLLRKYDTIIIDEAHERSLNIDFLLGYLKQLLPQRPDLKVIITSATIDVERFAEHFAAPDGTPAPIIEVSGRTYDVEVRYRPLMILPGAGDTDDDRAEERDAEGDPIVRDQTEAIVDAVKELSAEGPGDVLVFLPGEREIRDTADALAEIPSTPGRKLEIVPLFSRLSSAEQQRVFSSHPETVRRIVLSTNVAETSLTVPGIKYVVDSGLARISRYSVRTKVQRLPVEPISQASANQRSGRCGRVSEGIAIRLYSEEDFEGRPEFTDPEILRTNLASVILQMASLGLGDLNQFGFVEPPDSRNVASGVQLLEELGALETGAPEGESAPTAPAPQNSQRPAGSPRGRGRGRGRGHGGGAGRQRPQASGPRLTEIGRRLARLPIDPRLARMILAGEQAGCVREVIVIAAALSLQDPRERPEEHRAHADQLHARFKDEGSDFLTWLNLWRYVKEQQRELSSSAFRRMCRAEFLNYLRVREWQEFESQLRQVCKEMGIDLGSGAHDRVVDSDNIHRSLLSGLLSHIGALELKEKGERKQREYVGARGAKFAIFPGSVLKGRNPAFVMAGELVETGRLWARQNASIKPEWAEDLGAHLVKRTYSEPHWSKKRAAVVAFEKVTLYGVPLVADRAVNYGKVDRELSRELFIRHALVQREWHSRHRFLAANAAMLDEARELEERARRRDIVVDSETLFDFYDARVGRGVVSGAHFDSWWKKIRATQPDLLTFDPDMLTHDAADEVAEGDFPLVWEDSATDGLTFPIAYHFEPGAQRDGLTIDVPVATLNRVDGEEFSWLVPGLREELVTALIRSLPKNLRVNFVPAPNKAREFLAAVPAGEEPLLDALERWGRAVSGLLIPREAWDFSKVPTHLQPTFRVVDEAGREVGVGKDLEALKAPLRGQFAEAMAEVASDSGYSATGATTWVFGTLENSFTQKRAGHEVKAFPALDDEGSTVGVGVYGSAEEAEARHRLGVRRLLALNAPSPVAEIVRSFDNRQKLGLASSPYPNVTAMLEDARLAVLGAVVDAHPTVRDEAAFTALLAAATRDLEPQLRRVVEDLIGVLDAWRRADKVLSGRADMRTLPALTDMKGQLQRLMTAGFIAEAGPEQVRQYPRYLKAIVERRDKLESQVARDMSLMDQVLGLQDSYLNQLEALAPGRPAAANLRQARWMLEEFRVQLFAQQLGTAMSVSDQRIRKVLGA